MKVVILQNILSSNNVFSINTLMREFELKRSDVKVFFCAKTEKNRHWKLHENPRFSYQVLPSLSLSLEGKDLFTYFVNPKILSLLSTLDPDWIIAGGWDQFTYQAAIIWGKIHGKRVTLWSGSTVYEQSWRRTITKPLVRLLVHCSSDFLAYGTRAKEYLSSLGAQESKIKIFLNSVNHSHFINQATKLRSKRNEIKKKLKLKTQKNLLYVGQLIERKGILELLKAFTRFSWENSDWGLVIVGNGYLKDRIKQTIDENNLSSRIVLVANIEQYKLPAIYTACDCLILPSKEEVWGLVVNEAMASSLPVLVSKNAGAVKDLVVSGKNGYSFLPTEKGIIQVMRKISTKSKNDLKIMGHNSLRRILAIGY